MGKRWKLRTYIDPKENQNIHMQAFHTNWKHFIQIGNTCRELCYETLKLTTKLIVCGVEISFKQAPYPFSSSHLLFPIFPFLSFLPPLFFSFLFYKCVCVCVSCVNCAGKMWSVDDGSPYRQCLESIPHFRLYPYTFPLSIFNPYTTNLSIPFITTSSRPSNTISHSKNTRKETY